MVDGSRVVLHICRGKSRRLSASSSARSLRNVGMCAQEDESFVHPNCLSEAYHVMVRVKREKPHLLARDVDPAVVIRSAYATLRVVQDETTTLNLGILNSKYKGVPWGDLSSAALSMRLSDREKVPVVILDRERHFKEITEVDSQAISSLKI